MVVDGRGNVGSCPHEVQAPAQLQNFVLLRGRQLHVAVAEVEFLALPAVCGNAVELGACVPGWPKGFCLRQKLLDGHWWVGQNFPPPGQREVVDVTPRPPTSREVEGVHKLGRNVEQVALDALPLVVRHARHVLKVEVWGAANKDLLVKHQQQKSDSISGHPARFSSDDFQKCMCADSLIE